MVKGRMDGDDATAECKVDSDAFDSKLSPIESVTRKRGRRQGSSLQRRVNVFGPA